VVALTMTAPPPGTRLASRAYALALYLYPRALRREYGADMQLAFDARCRDARREGRAAVALLLVREIGDVAFASIRSGHGPLVHSSSVVERRSLVAALWQDIRYGARTLRRQPGFTAVAMVTLALGIGATTAVFTVVNGVLLRPLPYRDPDRLVLLLNGRSGRLSTAFSPINYRDVTVQSGVFADSAAFSPSTANLTGHGDPLRLEGQDVTWRFFSVLGATLRHGRGFVEADEAGGGRVIVLSDGLWRRQFGARADIVGTTAHFDGAPHTIVGIAAPEMQFPNAPDYWRPLVFSPENLSDPQRGAQWVGALARLKDGVTLEQATSAMAVVADRLAHDFPRTNKDRLMGATLLHERLVSGIRPALLVLLGAVVFVLLIACVNVANLQLARAYGRVREVAVRAALGAGRGRLVRQFIAESLVFGVVGGAAGLALADGATRVLVALGPAAIPRLGEIGLDWRVVAFAAATTIVTSVVFGLVPAFATSGRSLAGAATLAGRGSIGPAGSRIRKALVVCEMALAVVLLVGAGLLVRSYDRISKVDPGFSPDGLLTFSVALPESKYKDATAVNEFVSTYVRRLADSPGVERAAALVGLPLEGHTNISSSFTRQGEPDSEDSPSAGMRIVTPDYFRTLRIPLRSGRVFDAHDDERGPEVVVINEEAARRFWPGQNPIGHEIHLGVRLVSGVRSGQKTIVGIVGDVKYGGLDLTAPPEVYLPYAQHPLDSITFAVRTAGDPVMFIPTARSLLASLDRELPLARPKTMDAIVGQSIAERRFTMLLLAAFAATAVLLAAIGVYGVLAYLVSRRTQEIGVRLAMGATPGDVAGLFLREGAALATIGLIAGIAGALGAGRALTTLLYGVTATDPVTFAAVACTLGIAALAAAYLPARRAARVDPMEALRAE
jgi:putative ABC transport system permease protein